MATVYNARLTYPARITVNMASPPAFTFIAQSNVTKYQIKIYDISDNTELYDGGEITPVTPLYSTQTVDVSVPSQPVFTGVTGMFWTVTVWNGSDTITSRGMPFSNYQTPTLTLTVPATITEQSYEFQASWYHPDDIEVVSYRYFLLDGSDEVITETDWTYNSSLIYTFDGFLSGSIYRIYAEAYDANDVFVSSSTSQFLVSYTEPSIDYIPTVENERNTASILYTWTGAYIHTGVGAGTYSYVEDFGNIAGNWGLRQEAGSVITWTDIPIEADHTLGLLRIFEDGYEGKIFTESNTVTGDYFEVGYEDGGFYREQNGTRSISSPYPLSSDYIYLIYVVNSDVNVIAFYPSGSWLEMVNEDTVWTDLGETITWTEFVDQGGV